ncbi:MAG: hypothetical protein ACLQOO_20290 [Terriglobia bacterium]
MGDQHQPGLLEVFTTARPSHPLFCHQDFLVKLAEHSASSIGRRATFLMQRLAVDARRLHYKPTYGANRGWRRSRLGGNHGTHFYAWWAPQNAIPLKESGVFGDAPEDAVFLRDIRHHDDHSPLSPHACESHYLPITVRDLRREEYGPAPWTAPQVQFASARQPVRLLKGHPGSGKTTALWHAADATGAERVLYVTYSRDLAALARDYFDRYCSARKRFHVATFPTLIRQVLGLNSPAETQHEGRQRIHRDLAPFARTLGPWTNSALALYDEFHAHLVGDALPVAIGRFAASRCPRVSDDAYRERRTRTLGPQAVAAVLETAGRLERVNSGSLADRYFPELGLAWQAAERLRACDIGRGQDARPTAGGTPALPELLDFDCIAMDEAQDLTPIEAFVVVQLASLIRRRRGSVSLLMTGDEAQTVRPTDFEWGWLNDLLHSQVGTPTEHELASNLRSPRCIAELVNRAGRLYGRIDKQERPGGRGYAEIDDDATGQVLYCTAVPGPELDAFLVSLAAREGLALIALGDTVPAFLPESVRGAVTTVSEAKGLDFHSVCLIDAGRLIDRVLHQDGRLRAGADIEHLRKRLAIDQLRVALSRPTERLLWLDITPSDRVVRQSVAFLNAGTKLGGEISACVPAAVLKTLEEEELDPEERVQRCQADARQYLQIKPSMAWSRAQQAVTLLGTPGTPGAVVDEMARQAAYLTLAEICFTLGMRKTRLAPELGNPDVFEEARLAAMNAHRSGLAVILTVIELVLCAPPEARLQALTELARVFPRYRNQIEPWILVELGTEPREWVEALEGALFSGQDAAVLIKLLPPLYEALGITDRAARTQRLQQHAIQFLIKEKQFEAALAALEAISDRQPKLEAACHEGLGDLRSAARCYVTAGNLKEALNCYRSIPDMEAALTLMREIGDHPATASLEWVSRLQALVAERPERFTKTVTPAEKKFLQDLLERSLGVKRRPPKPRAPRKKASLPSMTVAAERTTQNESHDALL